MILLLEPGEVAGKLTGQPVVVRVEKCEICPCGVRRAGVAGGTFATICLTDKCNPIAEACRDIRRIVGGFIVDDDNLHPSVTRQALIQRALDRLAEIRRPIVGRNDGAENDAAHRATATRT